MYQADVRATVTHWSSSSRGQKASALSTACACHVLWEKVAVPQGKHAQASCSEATVLTTATSSHSTVYKPLNVLKVFTKCIHQSGEITHMAACLQIRATNGVPLFLQWRVVN